MELTKEVKQDYILKGGLHCPFCGSANISAGLFEGESMGQRVNCEDCQKDWWDIYKLVDIEVVELARPAHTQSIK